MVSVQRAACNHVMNARGRLLSTKEAQELHQVIGKCDSSLVGA